jgi:hypothetical protein
MGSPGCVVGGPRSLSIRATVTGPWIQQPFRGIIRRCLMGDCANV